MSRVKRKIGASVLTAVAACVLAGGVYLTWLWTAPPLPETADEAVALLSSPRYQRLSEQERRPYLDRVRQLGQNLSDEERRAWRERFRDDEQLRRGAREMGTEWVLERAREFAKADEAKRREVLDRVIGMQELARARGQGGRGGPPRDPAARAEHDSWIHDKIEQGDPQRQAYVSEFWKALRERRQQMGLPADPPMGGRGS